MRQERGRRHLALVLARGNSRNVVIERQRGELRSCEEAERQLFRLIMSTSHNLMLTGESDC